MKEPSSGESIALLAELKTLLPQCLLADRARLEARLHGLAAHPPRPDAVRPLVERWLGQARASRECRERRAMSVPQIVYPPALPISGRREEIVAALKAHPVVVIAGETGSGKTTQIPKMCLEAGLGVDGRIACTQPRRVAALSIARRVAEELGVHLGREVGTKIRFTDQSSPETLIKFVTDGILLAETQGDRDLREYEAIIIDEAHERSLNIDFLLGHLKLLLARRPELKLLITSATINTRAFSEAFWGAPIIEVSGRMFPVEVRYAAVDEVSAEAGDMTYIDAAAAVAETMAIDTDRGDILIFMPGERDIRETRDLIQGRLGSEAEIIPLFGRLSAGDQQRVFAPSDRRKVVIATNIAETSLTIPGIRFVIDAGLARISRYNPRTRTKRLPIEPISQSSANQRKGRAGRVESGVCVRLYSEEDFLGRPEHTQPEIQRANLAEVILRMMAFRLGEIETFPFLNPPVPAAINAGYQLLQELGAIDAERRLTALGRDLARLPIDPTVGRMLLESVREGCVEELLVIAAGLSIQDPRERPAEAKDAADQAHRKFVHPESDFLTLLNLWTAYHDQVESLRTQGQVRKFCKSHFVSYLRMREWIDLHAQLREALDDLRERTREGQGAERGPEGAGRVAAKAVAGSGGAAKSRPDDGAPVASPASTGAGSGARGGALGAGEGERHRRQHRPAAADPRLRYAAIHRSVLAGLLGHVAQRKERNLYRASGNREVMVFPGSSLFGRTPAGKPSSVRGATRPEPKPESGSQPEWIVAGEIVETSRLYARTLAGVESEWIAELGRHICKVTHDTPLWDRAAGRVLARERVYLHGLEVSNRRVAYGNIDPRAATEIFIKSALVEDDIDTPHRFLEHNRKLVQKIETVLTRLRHRELPDLYRSCFEFYAQRIENVSSVHELNRLLRGKLPDDPDFLCATEADLTGGRDLSFDKEAFPDAIQVGLQTVPLQYSYAPGEEHDGVTVQLPVGLVSDMEPARLQFVVPAFRGEQMEHLLRALPKSLRVLLMPLTPKAAEMAEVAAGLPDLPALSRFVREKYGVDVPPDAWDLASLPNHLRPRFEITARDRKVVAAGRNLETLREQLQRDEVKARQEAGENAWQRAAARWERFGLTAWTIGDVPERVEVTTVQGIPVHAWPGLMLEDGEVSLRLFRTADEAASSSVAGWEALCERALQKELAWLQKDLRALEPLKALYVTLGSGDELTTTAFMNLKRHLFRQEPLLPLTEARFQATVERARAALPGLAVQWVERVGLVLKGRQDLLMCRKPYPNLRADLDALVPPRFLEKISFERLAQYPRYLKAILIRAERAAVQPARDLERARQIQPLVLAYRECAPVARTGEARRLLADYRWLIEEFKVSLFAQELGTAVPVSAKRLQEHLERLRSAVRAVG